MFILAEDGEDYTGPSMQEILPVIPQLPDPIEVRWEGTREDFYAYMQFPKRTFRLHIQDPKVLDKTLWVLGGTLPLKVEELEALKKALTSKATCTWRETVESMGALRGTLVLTKLTAEALRAGRVPSLTCGVVSDCLHGGLHPQDADLILRLRSSR